MNTFWRMLLFPAFLAPAAVPSYGQHIQKGMTEVGGGVSFASLSNYTSSLSATTFALDLDIGYLFTDHFEMGFRPQIAIVSSGNSTVATLGLYISPSWNFKTAGGLTPFVGLLAGYHSLEMDSGTENGIGAGADGGLKIAVGSGSLLLLQMEYLYGKYHGDIREYETGTLSFGAGFRVLLGTPSAD